MEILLDTDLNSVQKDLIHTAQISGYTLLSLINDMLDRAKLDSGKLQIDATPFDLRSVLDEIISLFSVMSRENDIEVRSNCSYLLSFLTICFFKISNYFLLLIELIHNFS